tara:strand:- start:524 stop:922 length:399 start_codon:yes stop_codon:yes gene_type:complete
MMFVSCEEEDITSYDLNGTTWIAYQDDIEIVYDYGENFEFLNYSKLIFLNDSIANWVSMFDYPNGYHMEITDDGEYFILGNEIFIEDCDEAGIQTTEMYQDECLSGYINGDVMTLSLAQPSVYHINRSYHKQ